VTTLVIEEFAAPDNGRAWRRLELTWRRAADELAGRTMWCVGAVQSGHLAAEALSNRLWPLRGDGVVMRALRIDERQPALRVPDDGDELLGSEVRAGDVVMLHDPLAALLADAVKARGAHAVLRLPRQRTPETGADAGEATWLRRPHPSMDAYVSGWQRDGARGARRVGLAVFMQSPDVVSAKEVQTQASGHGYGPMGWTSLLADVVREDHDERVGGRLHPRPNVAAR
jgi:hypothetical protein